MTADNHIAGIAQTREGEHNEGPGGSIGPYRILQQLGEGGFGAVFEAAQEHPIKRRVALKLVKLGMDTREVIARFEAERQALALMDHPNIARVLDAGATVSGRPYFVMELVRGDPISTWCDRHKLPIVERLKLFEQVCQAVQHAHTKGVIHRDLKPSNVLVSTQDDQPVAKVIDFGIAKAIIGRLTDRMLFTAQHQMIGTPLYMSPEQAAGNADIDTRSDIYSLGVLLYELLTGTTPYEISSLRSAPDREIQRIICEVEPPVPSACLTGVTANLDGVASVRRSDARRLSRQIRGELDWIVMKAIEKDRTRRYETANGLAYDVHRYLTGLPVQAAPPSRLYRMRKFIRRHQVGVSAGLLVATALLVGIVGFAWQARIAQQRAAELEQVSKFQASMLDQVDPATAGELLSSDVKSRFAAALVAAGLDEPARAFEVDEFDRRWQRINATDAARELIDSTILRPAAQAIVEGFADQPVVAATLYHVLAERYRAMGMYEAAIPLQQRALEIRRHVLGIDHKNTLASVNNMGVLMYMIGRLEAVEPYFAESLATRRRTLGAEHPDTLASLNNMGVLLQDQGRLEDAEPYFREALESYRRVLGNEHRNTLSALANMGNLLQAEGKLDEAMPYFRELLDSSRRTLGPIHADTLSSIIDVGEVLHDQGKFDEARVLYAEALEGRRRALGEEHPDTLIAIANLGVLARDQGRLDEADKLLQRAIEGYRTALGDDHPDTLHLLISQGALRVAQGRHAEAVASLEPIEGDVTATFTVALSYRAGELQAALGRAKSASGDYAEAERRLLAAREIYLQYPGPARMRVEQARQALRDLYLAWHAAEPQAGYDAQAAAVGD